MEKQNLINFWKENYNFSNQLIKAFSEIKREDFVLKEYKKICYEDIALPILKRQTISQPTTVMLMLHYLDIKEGAKVLEIGTGSGYNAALLSKLVGAKGKVYTIEIIPELVEFAKNNLKNIKNIKIILADGSIGYKKEAPYDRIIYAAATPKIPILKQLKKDGVLIAPIGKTVQKLTKIKNNKKEILGDFVFVPLKGKYGF